MRKWRKMTWAIVAWSVLILIWAIAGGASNKCADQATKLNKDACEAGTGIGVGIILFLGFLGFIVLALIWFMTRPKDQGAVSGPQFSAPPTAPPSTPPGWHPDPDPQGPHGQLRWWDGRQWTDRTSASGPGPPRGTAR